MCFLTLCGKNVSGKYFRGLHSPAAWTLPRTILNLHWRLSEAVVGPNKTEDQKEQLPGAHAACIHIVVFHLSVKNGGKSLLWIHLPYAPQC